MSNAWSDLPNASLIDWVISNLRQQPNTWHMSKAHPKAARDAAWAAIQDAARDALWYEVRRQAVRPVYRPAASDALLALVAWDDCAELLDANPDHVYTLALLGHPASMLLHPTVFIRRKQELTSCHKC